MENLKKLYILSIILLGILIFFVYSQILSTTSGGTLKLESKQQLVQTGENIEARFSIYNNGEQNQNVAFALYFNDERMLKDTVLVKAGRRFEFGGLFPVDKPGKVKVTAELYDPETEKLLDTATYHVNVGPEE